MDRGTGGKRPPTPEEGAKDKGPIEMVPEGNYRHYLRYASLWIFWFACFVCGSSSTVLITRYTQSRLLGPEYELSFRIGSLLMFVSTICLLYAACEMTRQEPPVRQRGSSLKLKSPTKDKKKD